MSAYSTLTCIKLKDLLRSRRLAVSGNKPDLVARLIEADDKVKRELSENVLCIKSSDDWLDFTMKQEFVFKEYYTKKEVLSMNLLILKKDQLLYILHVLGKVPVKRTKSHLLSALKNLLEGKEYPFTKDKYYYDFSVDTLKKILSSQRKSTKGTKEELMEVLFELDVVEDRKKEYQDILCSRVKDVYIFNFASNEQKITFSNR